MESNNLISLFRMSKILGALISVFLLLSCATQQRLEEISQQHDSLSSYFAAEEIESVPSGFPSFYYDGTKWTERALELIQGADSYILIDTFLIGEHPQAYRIFYALSEASARGVEVRLIMDSSSHYRFDRTTGDAVYVPIHELRQLGLQVTEYNPIRAWRFYRHLFLLDRDHRKFWVIDGERVVAGGKNIDPDSLADPQERGSLDGMTEVYSPGAAKILVESFVNTWNMFSLDALDVNQFPIPEPDESAYETKLWVLDQNMDSGSVTTTKFDSFLSLAEEEIWMMQCYMILTPALLSRIEHAAERGVQIHVILSDNHVGGRFAYATYYGIKDLLRAGAQVYMYESPTGSLLHKKLIIADNKLVSVGTANYNFRSQYLSRELSFVFDDPAVAEELNLFLQEVLEHAREVDEKEAETYRGLLYFLSFLMMQVGG